METSKQLSLDTISLDLADSIAEQIFKWTGYTPKLFKRTNPGEEGQDYEGRR